MYRRWRAESAPEQRAGGLFWPSVILIGAVLISLALAQLVHAPVRVVGALLAAYALALLLLGVATLVSANHLQAAHRDVSRLLPRLQAQADGNGGLRGALAEVLADPTLSVHYRRADSGDYVDAHGSPAPLPAPGQQTWIT
ncbi:hypothetical protein [Streptomyces sp. NPDC090445]|uniref:hypothetical protein n=1 Tax=Streptomyces sp. NPDC090445 TaxID=3365963 RepID=UPI00382BF291